MAEEVILSPNSVIEWNGVPFRFMSGSIDINCPDVPANDSGNALFEENESGREQIVASIRFYRRKDVNPHAPPLNILALNTKVGDLKFRTDPDADPYHAPIFRCTHIRIDADATSNTLVVGTIDGKSHGVFYRPGET